MARVYQSPAVGAPHGELTEQPTRTAQRQLTREELKSMTVLHHYLLRAYRDKFNMHNFSVRADRIADDLGISTDEVIEAADRLVEKHQAERIERGNPPYPSYRINPSQTHK